ncbi:MAG: YjgP/YjgQ family permease, partial [Cytophagales bacterium]|nr:YjgP/YjgQ family permease [Cytophagales bacterium]
MKKLDKLIFQSFLAPFILTLVVVVFILLIINMLKYFDDFVGKDLGILVFGELLGYFAINTTPHALPLAILLSSLMTFGNLGEHFELTAIKSAGISLVRTLMPLLIFAVAMTGVAYLNNNHLVPQATLKALNLLYDIKRAKPSLDIQEGVFYEGIPGYTIKVNQKQPDGINPGRHHHLQTRRFSGNKQVTLADSGRMYTIMAERYLVLELFRGNRYHEANATSGQNKKRPGRRFLPGPHSIKNKMVFNLSSFLFDRSDDQFGDHRMKDSRELTR